MSAADGYFAVAGVDDGPLLGYCCRDEAARIPGLVADSRYLDVGVGMDPRWVGRGHGAAFGSVVMRFWRHSADGRPLRAVVQTWNTRSLRLAAGLGFARTAVHRCVHNDQTVDYAVLIAA